MAGLASEYLGVRIRADPGESHQQATEWATEQIGGRIQLLEPANAGYRLFDYLRDHLAETGSVTPGRTWTEALSITQADPERAYTVGHRAYQQNQVQVSIEAFRIGLLLAEQGDVRGARAAYQSAIDSGHPDEAPAAAVNLGVLLKEQGDVQGARAAWQLAIDSGHEQAATRAQTYLAELDP